jgi:hypothetical protein
MDNFTDENSALSNEEIEALMDIVLNRIWGDLQDAEEDTTQQDDDN